MKARDAFTIDNEQCLKCGGCVATYPEFFEFDEKENVLVKDVDVESEKVSKIAGICPIGVILINE